MGKFLVSLIGIFAWINVKSVAQTFILYGDKTFGGTGVENHVSAGYCGNSQLLLVGESTTYVDGDKTEPLCTRNKSDVWVLKIDTGFNVIWNRSIGGDQYDMYPNFIQAPGGDLILSCATMSDSSCEKSENNRTFPGSSYDYWVYRMDSHGIKLWDKTLGGGGADYYPDITLLSSGAFIVAGTSSSAVSGEKTVSNFGNNDYWSVVIDSLGNKTGDFVYGGTDDETAVLTNLGAYSSLLAVIPDEKNSYVLAGTTNSGIGGSVSSPGFGDNDLWIIKVDSLGNKVWDKTYGGNYEEGLADIVKTSNGYILAGMTNSVQGGSVSQPRIGTTDYDIWVVKLDSVGNKIWDRRFGGTSHDVAASIAIAPNGGYWVLGTTLSPVGSSITEPSYGNSDYWMFKIDNWGNKLWDKRFGGPGLDRASNFIIMPDTSIYICGYATTGTSVVKTDAGKGLTDYWMVHFKYDDYTPVGINQLSNHSSINIAPNPFTSTIKIENNAYTSDTKISIYDISGRLVYEIKATQLTTELDLSALTKGIYMLKLSDANFQATQKIVRQ